MSRQVSPTHRIAVIAHRGASSEAPENTLPAFERAVAWKSDALETDVRQTLDGRLILLHDSRVDRTTNGAGAVADMRWNELRGLDAGSWFDPGFRGTRVPLLSDFLRSFAHKIPIVLELKGDDCERLVVDEVRRFASDAFSIRFTSFVLEHLTTLKEFLPEASCGYLVRQLPHALAPTLRKMGITRICPHVKTLTAKDVAKWKEAEFFVQAWGVKTKAHVRRCLDLGLDGFTTDSPGQARAIIDGAKSR